MSEESRAISGPLMLGLVALPLVFFWFLLRPGYAHSTRAIVAIYMIAFPALSFAAACIEVVAKRI